MAWLSNFRKLITLREKRTMCCSFCYEAENWKEWLLWFKKHFIRRIFEDSKVSPCQLYWSGSISISVKFRIISRSSKPIIEVVENHIVFIRCKFQPNQKRALTLGAFYYEILETSIFSSFFIRHTSGHWHNIHFENPSFLPSVCIR